MQTQSQVRVINPILSNVAQGYSHPDHVGHMLFPEVDVAVAGGQIIEFGRESFRNFNARRTPGAGTKRIQFGYAGKPYALVQDALEGKVPYEYLRDASRVPGIELGSRAVQQTMKNLKLALEREQAAVAINAANYASGQKVALSGSTKWSHTDGDPTATVETGKEAVRAVIGQYPNTIVLSALAFKSAKTNKSIKENFKYTSSKSVTAEMLAELWDLEHVAVGKAITLNDDDTVSDVWGNNAILAYVEHNPSTNEEPSYGYTYKMLGHPMAEEPYQDRNAKSWIYPVTYERVPVLSGIAAGYLIQNPN